MWEWVWLFMEWLWWMILWVRLCYISVLILIVKNVVWVWYWLSRFSIVGV